MQTKIREREKVCTTSKQLLRLKIHLYNSIWIAKYFLSFAKRKGERHCTFMRCFNNVYTFRGRRLSFVNTTKCSVIDFDALIKNLHSYFSGQQRFSTDEFFPIFGCHSQHI